MFPYKCSSLEFETQLLSFLCLSFLYPLLPRFTVSQLRTVSEGHSFSDGCGIFLRWFGFVLGSVWCDLGSLLSAVLSGPSSQQALFASNITWPSKVGCLSPHQGHTPKNCSLILSALICIAYILLISFIFYPGWLYVNPCWMPEAHWIEVGTEEDVFTGAWRDPHSV